MKPTEPLIAWAIVYDSPKWKRRFMVLSNVYRTRSEAIRAAEADFGEPWRKLKRQGKTCERVAVQVIKEIR